MKQPVCSLLFVDLWDGARELENKSPVVTRHVATGFFA
jgi:hypothetical protein